ncbi:acyl-CoA dehydrogenase [Mycobacterium paraintracellulare]|uniref:acyl-CoA dehydrogenase family protein n=1 Tax=Mycobacterium paraintracellulare TaxID=1138383 RepID=UPI001926B369|nr:acyl-CoA dehydrogenase family protein [Mycobacterium paraintracellulare]BCO39223.1 acyl-CoA dehydrogenase [Mycobacterium paraintracellulare]
MTTERQQELDSLRSSVRRFLRVKSDPAQVRELIERPCAFHPAVWRQMAEQLGLQALPIPELYGGGGFSFVETGVVLQEMGRALYPGPFWSTTVAAQLILATRDDSAKREWLPRIADGSLIATVALADSAQAPVHALADVGNTGWIITGTKILVTDCGSADLLLVAARTDHGLGLFAVANPTAGLSINPRSSLDLTRQLSDIAFSAVPARLITTDASPVMERARNCAITALAAEQAGAAERCLETAVEYAKTRMQFGKPIGSFQAIKHKCADMLVQVESAKAAAAAAALAAADDADELPVLAAVAGAYCSDAFCDVAMENIQIHGGIGFTWEHDAHLYFRRAWSSRVLVSAPSEHRRRLSALIGL